VNAPPHKFVRDFLISFLENQFTCGLLRFSEFARYTAAIETHDLKRLAAQLFAHSPSSVEMPGGGSLRLVHLREIDGTQFPFLVALPGSSPARRAHVNCFVGHRFIPRISEPLRLNLAYLLEPHGIRLDWSAQDLSATQLFGDIVSAIRSAGMCFFDTRETSTKPNVYIEVGIAYALGIPTILTEYLGPVGNKRAKSVANVPSDLQGLFRIEYRTYEELCRRLYFGLPNFIAKNHVRSTRRRPRA